MILTLLAVSLNDQNLSQPITAHFDGRGGTIGRADHNTLALPDPERHVSRMQAEIIAAGNGFLIRNVGTANPIVVSGRIVAPGESAGLSHGDEIRVGGYQLQVESRLDDTSREIARGRALVSANHSSRPSAMPNATSGTPANATGQSALLPSAFDSSTPPAAHAPGASASPPQTGSVPLPDPHVVATEGQRLWAALCQGAGVDLPTPAHLDEERVREVGRLLRSAVEGTLRLMAVRTSVKHELRASVTVIQAAGNNPLKFSPDAKTGLEYLLQPASSGFLNGPAAMNDAMQDLVGHAIGTVAGMRAAMDGLLERFAPQAIEANGLTARSMLDSLLPSQRKAKLWDLYLQQHERIRADAQDDFNALFGNAFLAAYDHQIELIKRPDSSE